MLVTKECLPRRVDAVGVVFGNETDLKVRVVAGCFVVVRLVVGLRVVVILRVVLGLSQTNFSFGLSIQLPLSIQANVKSNFSGHILPDVSISG